LSEAAMQNPDGLITDRPQTMLNFGSFTIHHQSKDPKIVQQSMHDGNYKAKALSCPAHQLGFKRKCLFPFDSKIQKIAKFLQNFYEYFFSEKISQKLNKEYCFTSNF
jgi:hypothetical protein